MQWFVIEARIKLFLIQTRPSVSAHPVDSALSASVSSITRTYGCSGVFVFAHSGFGRDLEISHPKSSDVRFLPSCKCYGL